MTQDERIEAWLKEIMYTRGQFAGMGTAFTVFILHSQPKSRVKSYVEEIIRAEKIAQKEKEKGGRKTSEMKVFEEGFEEGLATVRKVLLNAIQDMEEEED